METDLPPERFGRMAIITDNFLINSGRYLPLSVVRPKYVLRTTLEPLSTLAERRSAIQWKDHIAVHAERTIVGSTVLSL